MQVSDRIRVNLSGCGSRETNLSKLINTLFVISFSLYMKYLKLHNVLNKKLIGILSNLLRPAVSYVPGLCTVLKCEIVTPVPHLKTKSPVRIQFILKAKLVSVWNLRFVWYKIKLFLCIVLRCEPVSPVPHLKIKLEKAEQLCVRHLDLIPFFSDSSPAGPFTLHPE